MALVGGLLSLAVIAAVLVLVMTTGKGVAKNEALVADGSVSGQLRALMDAQCLFLTSSDIDGYISTIDPSSPVYEASRSSAQQILSVYKLSFTLDSFQLLSANGSTATARTVITTKKVSGSAAFSDNRITAVQIFKQTAGQWLLLNSTTEKVDYLN